MTIEITIADDATDAEIRAALGAADGPDESALGYDIIGCWGQSNMAGRGAVDTSIDVTHPRVFQFGGASGDARYRTIFLASEKLHHAEGTNTTQCGPALAFARAYADLVAPHRRVLLVPAAVGGTAMVANPAPWSPDANSIPPGSPPNAGVKSSLYENAIYQAISAVNAARTLFPSSRYVGTIWLQGESDAIANITTAQYLAALTALTTGIRSRIPDAGQSWFIAGQHVAVQQRNSLHYQTIDAAMVQMLSTIDRTGLALNVPDGVLSWDGLTVVSTQNGDNLHYNALGQRMMGLRFAQQVRPAIANTAASTVLLPPPVAPSASVVSETSIALEWVAPMCRASNYAIGYRVAGQQAWTAWARVPFSAAYPVASAMRRETITGLTTGVSYEFAVATINANGTSAWSPVATARPAAVAPGQVTGLTVGALTANSVALSWAAPATGGAPNDYIIQYRTSPSGAWVTFADGTSTTRNTIVTGLTAGTAYDFRVQAANTGGSGSWSSTVTATPPLPTPGQVTGLTVGVISANSVALSWTAPASGAAVVDYQIQFRTSPPGSWQTFADGVSTTASAVVTGLVSLTAYDFQVAAVAAGNALGAYSSTVTATTTGVLAAPGQVTTLAVTAVTASSITYGWSAPSSGGAPTGYVLEYRASPSGAWQSVAVSGLTATVSGLAPSTAYDARITAQNSSGNGLVSNALTFSTIGPMLTEAVGVEFLAGYSPFKLRPQFTGAPYRVSRSADAQQMDVPFALNNVLDTASLLTFTGAGSAFVEVMRDQSAFGYDLSPYNQNGVAMVSPQIVRSGALYGYGGGALPSIKWGRDDGAAETGMSTSAVVGSNLAGADYVLMIVIATTVPSGSESLFSGLGNTFTVQLRNNAGGAVIGLYQASAWASASPGTVVIPMNQRNLLTVRYTEATRTYVVRLNGAQILSGLAVGSNTETDVLWGNFWTGAAGGRRFTGQMPQMIVWPALTDAQVLTAEQFIKAQWGTA